MLLNDFYKITSQEIAESISKFNIELNKLHDIFNGHFPGVPVVPGVCMMQIVRELLEISQAKKLQLANASNIKFLAVLNPFDNDVAQVELNFSIRDEQIKTDAVIKNAETVFFKMKAEYKSL